MPEDRRRSGRETSTGSGPRSPDPRPHPEGRGDGFATFLERDLRPSRIVKVDPDLGIGEAEAG